MSIKQSIPTLAIVGVVALIGAACSSGNAATDSAADTAPVDIQPAVATAASEAPVDEVANDDGTEHLDDSSSTAVGEDTSKLQPGAEDMEISIVSPVDGSSFSGNSIALRVQTRGFDLDQSLVGKGTRAGKGHYHVYRDGVLVNFFSTPTAHISMRNLEPGEYTFEVVPAQNDHTEISENAESVTLNWQPTSPPPEVQPANFREEPTINIISPGPDATVGRSFELLLDTKSFNPSCGLMGKAPVDGYGHWHLHIATSDNDVEEMGTLVAMGCTEHVRVSTKGLQSGAIYTLVAQLTDNAHAPLGFEGARDEIQIRVR